MIIQEMRTLQYHSYLVPTNLGGKGNTLLDAVKKAQEIAYNNPSQAWLFMVLSSTSYYLVNALGEEKYLDISDGSKKIFSLVTRPSGFGKKVNKNTYKINGRWDFGSGIEVSDYVICGVKDEDDGKIFHIPVLVDNVIIDKNWKSVGLQETQSHSFDIVDLYIKTDYQFSLARNIGIDNFYTPILSPIMAIISVGIVEKLLDLSFSCLKKKNKNSRLFRHYSELRAKFNAAELLLKHTADNMWTKKTMTTTEDRGNLRSTICYVTSEMYDIGCQLAALFTELSNQPNSDFYHFFNELLSARSHGQLSPELHHEAGQMLCGLDSDDFIF